MAHEEAERLALEAGAVDFVPKGEASATVLDRTIRFAIANVRRHALLTTMVGCMDAAVCIDDGAGRPGLWNPRFAALARRHGEGQSGKEGGGEEGGERTSHDCEEAGHVGALLHAALHRRIGRAVGDVMVDLNVTRIADGRSIVTLHDVSDHVRALEERERAMRRADHMATHCCLTGLPNRAALTARLDRMVGAAARGGPGFTLYVLDLDRFKEINDVHGHAAGDTLLVEVTRRMSAALGEGDVLGRMGGDEFIALSTHPDGDETLVERLLAAFDEPFDVAGRRQRLGISVGLAACPEHGSTSQALMFNADLAMYRAKKDPSVAFLRYTDEIDRQTREHLLLVADLKEAVADEKIDVHFQPQIHAATGELCGFEALARWHRPGHGAVSPARFVPLAEAQGLVPALGVSVLRKACAAAARWPLPVRVAVNVSALQLCEPDFDRTVHEVLLQTGLAPARLELEVTESILINDVAQSLAILRRLKALGVTLAVDDFGTGYSSLTTLATFPFDLLKIDRAFVRDMCRDPRMETMVKACINLGKSLGLDVIAEGVESPQQADRLLGLGCDQFQGHLFGRAGCDDEAVAAQKRRASLRAVA